MLASALADSSQDISTKLKQCLYQILSRLQAGRGAIGILNRPRNSLHLWIALPENTLQWNKDISWSSLTGFLVSNPEPLLIRDVRQETRFELSEICPPHYFTSVISCPIVTEPNAPPVGVIHLADPDQFMFTENELYRLTAFSKWLAPFLSDRFLGEGANSQENRNLMQDSSSVSLHSPFGGDLSGMLRMVLHDLKSPLAALITNLDLLQSRNQDHDQSALLSSAMQSAHNLLQRINRIPELFRLGDLAASGTELETVDLKQAITQQIQEHRALLESKRIQVHTQGPEEIKVLAEERLLQHLLQNLISNAIRYTKNEGTILFYWYIVSQQEEGEQTNLTTVCIQDSGRGIEEPKKEKLQEILQNQQSISGYGQDIGMGLLICSRIMEVFDGRIWIEDSTPNGTRICFTLHSP